MTAHPFRGTISMTLSYQKHGRKNEQIYNDKESFHDRIFIDKYKRFHVAPSVK